MVTMAEPRCLKTKSTKAFSIAVKSSQSDDEAPRPQGLPALSALRVPHWARPPVMSVRAVSSSGMPLTTKIFAGVSPDSTDSMDVDMDAICLISSQVMRHIRANARATHPVTSQSPNR